MPPINDKNEFCYGAFQAETPSEKSRTDTTVTYARPQGQPTRTHTYVDTGTGEFVDRPERLGDPSDFFYKLQIDTLKLRVFGLWRPGRRDEVYDWRVTAELLKKGTNEGYQIVAHDGAELQVLPHGASPYSVLLRGADGLNDIKLIGPIGQMPDGSASAQVRVSFGAAWCMERSFEYLIAWTEAFAEYVGLEVDRTKISELHLRVDADHAPRIEDIRRVRGNSRRCTAEQAGELTGRKVLADDLSPDPQGDYRIHHRAGALTGLNNLRAGKTCKYVFYDKALEVRRTDNTFWRDTADHFGIDVERGTWWRFELRLNGDQLRKKFGVVWADELTPETLRRVWGWFTQKYILFVDDPDQERTERAGIVEWWRKIQEVGELASSLPPPKIIRAGVTPLLTQAAGCIVATVKRSGADQLGRALSDLVDEVYDLGLDLAEARMAEGVEEWARIVIETVLEELFTSGSEQLRVDDQLRSVLQEAAFKAWRRVPGGSTRRFEPLTYAIESSDDPHVSCRAEHSI